MAIFFHWTFWNVVLGTLVFGQADRGKSIRERLRSKEIVFVRNHRSRSANVINFDNRNTTTPTNTFNEQSTKNSSSSSSRVPLLIKKQIEHILSTNQSPKPLTVEQFKQSYIRTFGFLFNPKAFGSENLTDFLKSVDDLVRLRPVNDDTSGNVTALGEDQTYIELVQNVTGHKFNLNVLNFNNLVPNDVNNNNNVLVEPLYGEITEQTRVKTRPVTVYDFNEGQFVEHTLNLIAIDKQIYVHWSQVARLFNLTEPVFKLIINQTGDMFVRKFKHNANNEILFDLIENRLKIATSGHRDERDEDAIVLVYYDRLFKCCDFIFRDENSKSLKQLIVKFWSE